MRRNAGRWVRPIQTGNSHVDKTGVTLSMFSKGERQLDYLHAGFEETSYHTGSLFCEGIHILGDSSTEVKK